MLIKRVQLVVCIYMVLIFFVLLIAPTWSAGPENVLVVINDNSPASREIGSYYVAKRKIPAKNVVHIKCTTEETIPDPDYPKTIEKPIMDYLKKTGLCNKVDYIVLTKGIPIKITMQWAVDSLLACADLKLDYNILKQGAPNPYFGKKEHFSHKKYGIYLVTRLDGYTVKDAKALVDRSLAAKPQKGVFLLDMAANRYEGGYAATNFAISQAHDIIKSKGYISHLDKTAEFVGGQKGLMGYFSWGSNDSSFDRNAYKSNEFLPGAIAETAVSTSARTFKKVDDGGQSLIADLIEAGVTGVKGYVSEPYLSSIADPRILFDRYLSGYNLAESFYMASRRIYWKDIVVGDPLCAPYATTK
jgi:uncharacterized protein (TIGR03790 family)